jgi:serine/threonine protein kinase/tetratricopeptide (TPR) repeat protein
MLRPGEGKTKEAAMAITCPKCRADNPETVKFCGECGTPLATSQITPGSKPMPPPATETMEAPREELTTGSLFAGRYQIIEELGHGGMGRVYRALDKKLNEEVALKLIRPEIAADRSTLERFHNELKLARKISHPHVGRMYELMDESGTHFITMEYVAGQDLRGLIRQTGKLAVETAVSITKQVCEGLGEAHKQGVIHRDLKPSNIIIDRAGSARIMDFGIARSLAVKSRTGAGVMIGTPEYMSPEQVEGKEVDQRSDIYSLGIILYEMLTGRVPFEGDTPFTVGIKHKGEAPKNPKALNPNIPDDLSGIILKCLEKDKAQRYQAAADVRTELERVEKGLPTTAHIKRETRPFTSREITVTFRLKKLIIPAAALLAVIAAGIVLLKVLPRKGSGPPSVPLPSAAAPAKAGLPLSEAWSNSIAVLPFVDLSPQRDQEPFCDGMTGDIIGQLSRISELKVISRNSTVVYRNSSKTVKEIARELGVAHVLEGNVQREGEAIRVNVQMIDAASGFQIWSERYDRKLAGYFALQDEISQAIASALRVKLTADSPEALKASRPDNMALYDTYLRAMYFISSKYVLTYREEDFAKALQMFEEAKKMDPGYAPTYVGLAWAYFHRYQITDDQNDAKQYVLNAEKAYQLGPELHESNLAKGFIHFRNGEYDQAFEKYRIGLEKGPNDWVAYAVIGYAYYLLGLNRTAIPFCQKALELAPFYLYSKFHMAWCLMGLGEYETAEGYLRKALDLNPQNPFSLAYLADYLVRTKRLDEAEKIITELEGLAPGFRRLPAQRAELYAARGEKDKALELSRGSSLVYALLGMKDEAIDVMQKSLSKGGSYRYLDLTSHPFYSNLRGDPRFEQIVAQAKKKYEEWSEKYGSIFQGKRP